MTVNKVLIFLISFLSVNAFAGNVSRYCPAKVLLCETDESCKSKKVYINTSATVFFGSNGLVESLNVKVTSAELDSVYGEFKNPMVKQKLGFVILENENYYLAVPLQKSKGLYLKERKSASVLAPGEKKNGAEWNLICNG